MKRGIASTTIVRHLLIAGFLVLSASLVSAAVLVVGGDLEPPDASRKISVNLKGADLQDVLRMFSEKAGLNLVLSDAVSGTVTMNLQDATPLAALVAVLDLQGFAIEQKGEMLLVKPKAEVAGPPFPQTVATETYKLDYVPADETAEILKTYLSPSGRLMIHKSNNVIIIEDISETFAKIGPLIAELDQPPLKVLIEAEIIEVRLTDDQFFGVDWSKAFSADNTTGTIQDAGLSRVPGAGAQGFFFNLSTPSLNILLDALQQKGVLNTLATPKLLAANHKPAQIVIGGRLGFRVTTTANQVTTESVEFLDIGTQLKLTPHIDEKGNIMMEVHPEVSDGAVTGGLPSKNTTEVSTTLVARDGETIFIGGLIREREEEVKSQVPILGSIPFLGALFRRTETTTLKSEIIVLITPHLSFDGDALSGRQAKE